MPDASDKRAQNQTFGSGYRPLGWGLPREGVGGKKSLVCHSKPRKTNFWAGHFRIFAGMSQGGRKV